MIEPAPKVDKAKQEEKFKQREKEEVEALRRVSYEAKEQEEKYYVNGDSIVEFNAAKRRSL